MLSVSFLDLINFLSSSRSNPSHGHLPNPRKSGGGESVNYLLKKPSLEVLDNWTILLVTLVHMSGSSDDNSSPHSQLSSQFFGDLLDSIVMDVASECHRVARLGLDRNLEGEEEELRLSAQARVRVADPTNSGETNRKHVEDIFGQTHPAVANEIFECMNCGRSIMAGRFAPHLEKCMGKGRKARIIATRSSTASQSRHSRRSTISVYSPYSNSNRASRGNAGAMRGAYNNRGNFDKE